MYGGDGRWHVLTVDGLDCYQSRFAECAVMAGLEVSKGKFKLPDERTLGSPVATVVHDRTGRWVSIRGGAIVAEGRT